MPSVILTAAADQWHWVTANICPAAVCLSSRQGGGQQHLQQSWILTLWVPLGCCRNISLWSTRASGGNVRFRLLEQTRCQIFWLQHLWTAGGDPQHGGDTWELICACRGHRDPPAPGVSTWLPASPAALHESVLIRQVHSSHFRRQISYSHSPFLPGIPDRFNFSPECINLKEQPT